MMLSEEEKPVVIFPVRVGWKDNFPLQAPSQFYSHSVYPEPSYPCGRKGLVLASLWEQQGDERVSGMLILDADVAIEPGDYSAMITSIAKARKDVHTAAAKIFPACTGYPDWVWSHRKRLPAMPISDAVNRWQVNESDPDMFSFCFTYLPRRLLVACIKDGMKTWHFPNVDKNVSDTAFRNSIPVHTVPDITVKHLHY